MADCRSRFVWAVSLGVLTAIVFFRIGATAAHDDAATSPRIQIRGIYGGVPTQILDRGRSLADYGVNAVWLGSGSLTRESIGLMKRQGAKVFAEFNTMHNAAFLKDHPDAAPVGPDGMPCPPPDGWQGVCPTHPGYRKSRMEEFRQTLRAFEVDGIWLDYHHAHANWEQAVPSLPDTCFCAAALPSSRASRGPNCRNARSRSWPVCCSDLRKTSGRSGVAACSPPGFASSAISVTKYAPRTARDIPLPVDGGGLRRGIAGQAGHRPEGSGRVSRRSQSDAVPRPVRSFQRPGLDRPTGHLAGPPSGNRRKTRRAAQDLADCPTLRLGRVRPGGTGRHDS